MKLQSAMEYLTTYGWAILIIAIILVAFFALGVFNSNAYSPKAQPGSCSITRNQYGGASESGVCTNEIPQFVAQFDGSNYIHGTNNNVGSYIASTHSGTISLWVDFNTRPIASSWTEIFDTQSNNLFFIHADSSNLYVCDTPQSSTYPNGYVNCAIIIPESDIPIGKFIQITATMGLNPGYTLNYLASGYSTSAHMKLYINGVLIASADTSPTYDGYPSPFQINSGSAYWEGSMANVQLYDIALSSNEVSAIYQEGIGGPPIDLQDLVGWWPLNGNANDYSGYSNGGTSCGIAYSSNWYGSYSAP